MNATILSKILDWLFASRVDRRDLEKKWHAVSDQLVIALDAMGAEQRSVFSADVKKFPELATIDLSGATLRPFINLSGLEGVQVTLYDQA